MTSTARTRPAGREPRPWIAHARSAPVTWWRRLTLRGRISLISTGVVAVGVILGAVVLVLAVRISLERTLDSSARRAGANAAALVRANQNQTVLPISVAGAEQVQLVNAAGTAVRGGSPGSDLGKPLLNPDEMRRALEGGAVEISAARAAGADALRVVAVPVGNDAGEVVLVATPASRIADAENAVRDAALVGAPVGLLAVAVLTYLVVGRTLQPVAALRAGARSIAAGGRVGPEGPRLPLPTARDEIYRLAVTLNSMLDRIAAAQARQRSFVDDAAHEFRSPLASLRVQLEVAGMLGPATDWQAVTADAMVDVERLQALVDDMLALARLDSAADRPTPAPDERIPVAVMTHDVLTDYPDVEASVDVADDVAVDGQQSALRRVLVNLLDNARRHARSHVTLRVDRVTDDDHDVVRFVVADDGPGIPVEERENVFDRFYRVDTARARDDGGTGLGLAIVRDVVAAHHGTVTLGDNHPGLLATVTVPVAD
jgi:signal transduction histidine kinase